MTHMRKSISWETNHQLLYPQKYPTRERRESQVTEPCISCVDVVVLCFCTLLIAVVGYLIFMVGAAHYLHGLEYSVKGQCQCIDSEVDGVEGSHHLITTSYRWRIWNDTICKGRKDANYTFFVDHMVADYEVGSVHDCFTNDECDAVHIEVEDHRSKSALSLCSRGCVCHQHLLRDQCPFVLLQIVQNAQAASL